MRSLIPMLSILALPECGSDPGGDYEGYLILKSEEGMVREFFLGGYHSMQACFEIGAVEFEDRNPKSMTFWTNPEFDYGGSKGGDDWMPHSVERYVCRIVRTTSAE